jgi:hypothetical protein
MTETFRPVSMLVTVCDLCDKVIPKLDTDEVGSLTYGYLIPKVLPHTKTVRLLWPPDGRKRRLDWKELQEPENRERRYDFHAQCVLDALETAISARKAQDQSSTEAVKR